MEKVITYKSGATRTDDATKFDLEGFISPLALKSYAEYMTKKRQLPDGTLRESDNWQLGIPINRALKSLLRHVHDLWLHERGFGSEAVETIDDSLAAILFNTQLIMHERRKQSYGKRETWNLYCHDCLHKFWSEHRTGNCDLCGKECEG